LLLLLFTYYYFENNVDSKIPTSTRKTNKIVESASLTKCQQHKNKLNKKRQALVCVRCTFQSIYIANLFWLALV